MALGFALRTSSDSTATTTPTAVRCSSGVMLRLLALVVFGVTITPNHCILPEIANNGIHHILDYNSYHVVDEAARDNIVLETVTEHPPESTGEGSEDASDQLNQSEPRTNNLPSSVHDETGPKKVVVGNHSVQTLDKILDNNIPTGDAEDDFTTSVVRAKGKECVMAEDCGRGRYCLYDTHKSKCLPCKAVDVPCTKDEECCHGYTCVWGQCTANATKGEAGRTCVYQTDCRGDLCCAVHKALQFPVCSAKPIERERCLGPSNHVMRRLPADRKGEGPLEHCPCVRDLQCQPLGRGSLCLQGPKSSEEELADTLYSEIDYIV